MIIEELAGAIKINKLPNIETPEREDAYVAVRQIAEMRVLRYCRAKRRSGLMRCVIFKIYPKRRMVEIYPKHSSV